MQVGSRTPNFPGYPRQRLCTCGLDPVTMPLDRSNKLGPVVASEKVTYCTDSFRRKAGRNYMEEKVAALLCPGYFPNLGRDCRMASIYVGTTLDSSAIRFCISADVIMDTGVLAFSISLMKPGSRRVFSMASLRIL